MPSHNPNAPHCVIIHLAVEIQEKTPTGECCGHPCHARKDMVTIEADNYDDAIRKLNETVHKMRNG